MAANEAHFGSGYTFDHLEVDSARRQQFAVSYYETGHMMYVHKPSLEMLAAELRKFVAP